MASMERSLASMASELSREELERTEELFEETPTRSYIEEHPDDAMFLEAMGAYDTIGIGVFIFCHGKCTSKIRRIPSGIKIMKKNVYKCGVYSPIITFRHKSQTPEIIADELTRSFSPAFKPEECQANAWDSITDGVLKNKKGVEVPLSALTCEEFNTTRENTTDHFVYKIYVGKNSSHRVVLSYDGRTIDLLRCSMQNILDIFGRPSPRHPKYSEIMTIIEYIEQNIGRRGQIAGKSIISTDFIFNMAKYLNLMHDVNIVRILDESCNDGISSQPRYPNGRPVGYGGKKSKKRKRKHRKSKKILY
jgi:hypothetical protein